MREEPEQTIAKFLKGLNLAILERVKLQPFWTFEDACKLAAKVKKQLISRRNYPFVPAKPAALVKTFNSFRHDPHPKEDRDKGKDKELAREAPKGQKKYFKCHRYGHFQADCPNRRVLTIKEIDDLDHMKK